MTTKRPDANDILRMYGEDGLRDAWDHATVITFDENEPEAERAQSNGHESRKPGALNIIRPAAVWDSPPPSRRWHVPDMIPSRQVTLLSGDGGVGKSLLFLQLALATALGRDWIGTMPEPGRVAYLTCEDDEDEIHRRAFGILGANPAPLADLLLISQAGRETTLAVPERGGVLKPTALWNELEAEMLKFRPTLIGIDNIADVYGGNENDRPQVRRFVSMLLELAIRTDAALVLIGHPSAAGLASGSGLSGSTAWHNSVRSRLYLDRVKAEDGVEPDPDLRALRGRKLNYGRAPEDIMLRWRDGVLIREAGASSIETLAQEARAKELFLQLLGKINKQGQRVSANKGPTYAPAAFAQLKEAKGISGKLFAKAMQDLLDEGRIHMVTTGSASRQRSHLEVIA